MFNDTQAFSGFSVDDISEVFLDPAATILSVQEET